MSIQTFLNKNYVNSCMAFKFSGDEKYNILVAKLEIENEETFHMKNLYKMIYNWLLEEGFTDLDNGDYPEIMYIERILGSGSKEHRIWWRCIQVPKKSQYYRYYLKIDYMTLNMKSIEVMHQGHKMKTDRGDCIIRIWAYLQLDYTYEDDNSKGWRSSPFMMRWDKLFRNRIYKAQIESYKVDLYKTSYRLQNVIKQYLKLKTLYEIPRPFQPERGL